MMQTDPATVFRLWCRLTGTAPDEFGPDELAAFYSRPQLAELASTPYEQLLDAGIDAARHGVLPLERWLGAVHRNGERQVTAPGQGATIAG